MLQIIGCLVAMYMIASDAEEPTIQTPQEVVQPAPVVIESINKENEISIKE